MINKILSYDSFLSEFDIENQKVIFSKYSDSLPDYFLNKNTISKDDVINIISDGENSKKTEFLAILFWGVYFVVIKKEETISSLINFINKSDFEKIIEENISLILNNLVTIID